MQLQTRVDALANDLIGTVESDATEPGICESTLKAIAGVFAYGGKNISPPNVTRALDASIEALASTSSGERACASLALSRAFAWSPTEERTSTLEKLNLGDASSAEHREGFAEALCQISRANGKLIMDEHASITLDSRIVRRSRREPAS